MPGIINGCEVRVGEKKVEHRRSSRSSLNEEWDKVKRINESAE
jgi:hypothetical protein